MGGAFDYRSPAGFRKTPTAIINRFSSGGASQGGGIDTSSSSSKQILSGALTAATYKSVLSVSGAGSIKLLCVRSLSATARTVGIKLILDGVTVFDATTNSVSTLNDGQFVVGNIAYGTPQLTFDDVHFNTSFSVWLKSSLSETDQVAANIIYNLE